MTNIIEFGRRDERVSRQVISGQVALVTRIFGTETFANPQQAHTEYETDSRVLKLLVGALERERGEPKVRLHCSFLETFPDGG